MTNRVFVDGLPTSVSPEEIASLLDRFGPVERIELRQSSPESYAFVDLVSDQAAAQAERELNLSTFRGRTLCVLALDR